MPPILDEYGLVRNGQILVIEFPSLKGFVPIRIKYRKNEGYEHFIYGPLPFNYPNYEEGVLPAGKQDASESSITLPYNLLPAEQASDMFFYIEPDTLVHAYLHFSPILMRILVEVPQGYRPYSFYGKVSQDVTRDFGWFRGTKEFVFLPKMHVGWRFYNPTNLDLRTNLVIDYAEYSIELVKEPEVIYRIITESIPYHKFVFGGMHLFAGLEESLSFLGIPEGKVIPSLPSYTKKEIAIKIINEVINSWKR